ncbi:helix-turn-helix domain-containing protein [Candidatus Woesearchaeota archaeon]|nr:helix-turn-helix domain-containing protein [Candidatus Woesearchaeota archaeon]
MDKTPQEMEVWYVLPAIRRELAKNMLKLGLKQKEIAKALKIAESAVSQYLKSKRAKEIDFPEEIAAEIKHSAEAIVRDNSLLMAEIQRLCILIRKSNLLCELHKKHAVVPEECDICLK